MGRVQKTLDQQLADIQAQREKLDARAKALEDRRKARDLRQRAKAEKLLLQVVLCRLDDDPAFRNALFSQLDAAKLKPIEHEAVLTLLNLVQAAPTQI